MNTWAQSGQIPRSMMLMGVSSVQLATDIDVTQKTA